MEFPFRKYLDDYRVICNWENDAER